MLRVGIRMNNDEILLDFWQNYKWPNPRPIFYRLYYDEHGAPIFYSMEDLPGQYVEVTQQEYAIANSNVKVRDGQIIPNPRPISPVLAPSIDSGTPCALNDVCIVVSADQPHRLWKLKYHE